MPVYLIYLLVLFLPPVLVLGWVVRDQWKHARRTLLWSLVFIATIGLGWDWISVRTGVWRYDSAPTVGIWLCGLPIEEFVGFYGLGTLLLVEVSLLFGERKHHV